MIRAYSTDICASENSTIPFNVNKLITGKTVSHQIGSDDIIVNTPGYYEVHINLSGIIKDDQTVKTTLLANNVTIADAIAISDVKKNTNFNHNINTIIKAFPGDRIDKMKLNVKINTDVYITNVSIGVNRLAPLCG